MMIGIFSKNNRNSSRRASSYSNKIQISTPQFKTFDCSKRIKEKENRLTKSRRHIKITNTKSKSFNTLTLPTFLLNFTICVDIDINDLCEIWTCSKFEFFSHKSINFSKSKKKFFFSFAQMQR